MKLTYPFLKCLYAAVFVLFLQQNLKAQYSDMSFEHMTLKDGLSQVSINAMIQDSYGFVWIATQDGLNRYDGVNNKIYRPVLEDPETTIAGTFINDIFEDDNGDIWIGTFSGLSKYDRSEDRFYNFYHNPNDSNSISDNLVGLVRSDSYGNIWVITAAGADKLIFPTGRPDSVKVVHLDVEKLFGKNLKRLTGWSMDKNGDIWISSINNGLYKISKEEQLKEIPGAENFAHKPDKANSVPSNDIWALTTGPDGNLWMFLDKAFTKVISDGDNVSFEKYEVNITMPGHVHRISFFVDNKGNALLGQAPHGFFVYNFEKKQLYSYKKETYNPRSLIDNNITSVLKDNSGVLWLGTANGISKYNPDKNKFKHFEPQPNNPDWLKDPFVFSMSVDKKGEYWVGTNNGNGVYVYSPTEKKFRNYTAKPGDRNALQGDFVFSVFRDSDDDLWIGTDRGLSIYNYNNNTFKTYQSKKGDSTSLSHNFIRCIIEGKDKTLWIGTNTELNSFDKKTGEFKKWGRSEGGKKVNNIQSLAFDKEGNLWVGTFLAGLVKMEFKPNGEAKYTKYEADITDSTSLSSNQVSNLLVDHEGNLWVATYGGGINKLDIKNNKFTYYTTKDGLPSNNFYGLLEDNNKNIWFSSSAGLSMLDRKTRKFVNYDINDGLQSNEFNGASCYKDENGLLYFGGVNGFNVFDPDEIYSNSVAPKIVFTDFKVNNKTVVPGECSPLKTSIQTAKEVVLSYRQRDISFEFAALHFVSPTENHYAYKIEGYDEDWINLGAQNYISLKSFPHGEYVLRVKAANCDGVWDEEGISLKVIINPPFWATIWFKIVALAFVAFCIWGYIKLRTRNLRKEKERLEGLVEKRTHLISEKNEELKQQGEELKSQNEEITAQRDQLEVQHNAITDSIIYAKRIQTAVLPRTDYIDEVLPENFVLFRPRNVVSGDFYWVKQVNNYIIIAVADCTGHGVPGAIMSMLGVSFINEIVQNKEIVQTNEVLTALRKKVKQALRQTGKKGEADDGMDMALCALDTKTKVLQYSGANNPFYLIRNGELTIVRPDKMPIGYYPNEKPYFTNHEMQLSSGDTFYLFSDGFVDQFGGKKGFKYRPANFQKLLLENHGKPLSRQKDILEKELKSWMNGHEQTDDILVMGVRV